MKRIIVKYSGDFRRSKVVNEIYGVLRDKGFDPTFVNSHYSVSLGTGEAEYTFKNGITLPEKSKLEEMLKGMNFNSIEILSSEEGAQ